MSHHHIHTYLHRFRCGYIIAMCIIHCMQIMINFSHTRTHTHTLTHAYTWINLRCSVNLIFVWLLLLFIFFLKSTFYAKWNSSSCVRARCPKLDRLNGQANNDGESRFFGTTHCTCSYRTISPIYILSLLLCTYFFYF